MGAMGNGNGARISVAFVLLQILSLFNSASPQPFIGVNYGQVADNLPPPATTARLLQSTTISKVRLYGVDPAMIQALAHTNISIVIGASNADIPSLATDPAAAPAWVAANVAPYYPASAISTISVGNEVLLYGDAALVAQLLPAMRNLQAALAARAMGGIKVSTVHSMAVLQQSDPPSSGLFDPAHADVIKGVGAFLLETRAPFMVNPYPYFAYQSDPRPDTLAFCLFQPNQGRVDAGTKIRYTNMFDAQVDAVRSALNAAGLRAVDIVVAETGWPYNGDPTEAGASVDNARAYNGNLVAHLRSKFGTPLMPGKAIDTYLFALYDENLKPGPTSERSFGLYKPDLTMTYDVGLARSSQQGNPQSSSTAAPSAAKRTTGWCVPKAGTTDIQLQVNLDYACGQPGVDCSAIQPGGACFLPNTISSHATYAMNMLYQAAGKNPWNCDFSQTATISSQNPSYGGCVYPGS